MWSTSSAIGAIKPCTGAASRAQATIPELIRRGPGSPHAEDHHDRLPGEQQLAAVVVVGEPAGGEHEHRVRHELARREQLDHEWRAGLLLHQPALGHGLHPVAGVADQGAEPDPTEGWVAEDGEHRARTYTGTGAGASQTGVRGVGESACERSSPASSPGRGSPHGLATTSTAGWCAIRRETSASIRRR